MTHCVCVSLSLPSFLPETPWVQSSFRKNAVQTTFFLWTGFDKLSFHFLILADPSSQSDQLLMGMFEYEWCCDMFSIPSVAQRPELCRDFQGFCFAIGCKSIGAARSEPLWETLDPQRQKTFNEPRSWNENVHKWRKRTFRHTRSFCLSYVFMFFTYNCYFEIMFLQRRNGSTDLKKGHRFILRNLHKMSFDVYLCLLTLITRDNTVWNSPQLLSRIQCGSYLTCTESTSPAVAFCCACVCVSVTMWTCASRRKKRVLFCYRINEINMGPSRGLLAGLCELLARLAIAWKKTAIQNGCPTLIYHPWPLISLSLSLSDMDTHTHTDR